MSRIQYFSLIYDRPHKFYIPGELVTGRAVLMLNDEHPLQVHGVVLELCGEARSAWTETESYKSANGKGTLKTLKRTVNLQARRDYLSTPVDDGSGERSSSISLQVHGHGYLHGGLEHSWQFEFQLPRGIPSSFQGRYGSIRYYIKGIVMRHNSTGMNYRTKSFFNLIAPEDCNTPQHCSPLEYVDEKRSLFYCCKTSNHPVRVKIRIDRQAYIPLDAIAIHGQFDNRSSLDVEPHVKLIQTVMYKASPATSQAGTLSNGEGSFDAPVLPNNSNSNNSNMVTKIERNKLKQLHCSMIKAKSSTGWKPLYLQIPKVAPTIRNCDIISVEYHVKIRLKSMLDNDMECLFPIVIATIPYRGAAQQQQYAVRNDDIGQRNLAYTASPATLHQQLAAAAAATSMVSHNRAMDTGKFSDYGTATTNQYYGGDNRGGGGGGVELSSPTSPVVPSAPPAYWDLFPLPSDEFGESEQEHTTTVQAEAATTPRNDEQPASYYLSCP